MAKAKESQKKQVKTSYVPIKDFKFLVRDFEELEKNFVELEKLVLRIAGRMGIDEY